MCIFEALEPALFHSWLGGRTAARADMSVVAIIPAMLSLGFAAAFSTPPLLRASHPAARAASGASVTCSIWSSGVGLYVSTKSSRARQVCLYVKLERLP